jgi:hypothetical protein
MQLQQGFATRGTGLSDRFALQKFRPAHVRLGSKADIAQLLPTKVLAGGKSDTLAFRGAPSRALLSASLGSRGTHPSRRLFPELFLIPLDQR